MKNERTISILVVLIAVLALVAAGTGVSSTGGPGPHEFTSMYGETIVLRGEGLYRNMSASTARDGIAQDVITIALAVPLLLTSLASARKGSLRGKLLLTGTLLYFLFTYLVYMVLAVFNEMFLAYVILSSISFFAFILTLMSIDPKDIGSCFPGKAPIKFIGGVLIFIPLAVALMWLGRIIPPIINGAAPVGIEHYTTLPVQALDLAIMHPAAVLVGMLLIRRKPIGYLLAPVFTTFLTIMMAAIAAKVVGQMLLTGMQGLPILIGFLIFAGTAMICTVLFLRDINEGGRRPRSMSR